MQTIEEILLDLDEQFPDKIMLSDEVFVIENDFFTHQGDEIGPFMEENGIYIYHNKPV